MNKTNVITAIGWAGLSAAVIYGIKKTGSLAPLFAFGFAPAFMHHDLHNQEDKKTRPSFSFNVFSGRRTD